MELKTQPRDSTKEGSNMDSEPVKDLPPGEREYLAQTREIIIYRVQALYLAREDLKDAFEGSRSYSEEELEEMLTYQPFLLNKRQSSLVQRCVLRPGRGSDVGARMLAWLGSFPRVDEAEEEEMIDSLAEFVTEYQGELQTALKKYAENADRISR